MPNSMRPGALALLTVGALIGSFLTDPAPWLDRLPGPLLPEWMQEQSPVEASMALQHVSALEMAAVLADLTPPELELEVDLASNRVIARGERHVIQHVVALVHQLDTRDERSPAWSR